MSRQHRDLIHKIGVTGGKVETRIADAEHRRHLPSGEGRGGRHLQAGNINRTRMENLFHRVFASARLDIAIKDRFGHPVQPQEWFLVPLFVVDEAVSASRTGR